MKRTGEGYEKKKQALTVTTYDRSADPLKQMTRKILRTIAFINEKHPELNTFLNEMSSAHVEDPSPEMEIDLLEQYFESLLEILKNYRQTHPEG